jgi:NitT/TauT family transport system substrate-binding protein
VIELNIGIVQADCAANLLYAQELGLFERAGLDVRLQPMPGERDRVHTGGGLTQVLAGAVAGGGLDIGVANVLILALARADGLKLRYIAPATVVLPGPRQIDEIFVRRDSALAPGPGANGATVAINRLKNLQQVLACDWHALHGGDPSTLRFVEVAFESMGDALASGEADIIMTTEPFGTIYADVAKSIGNAFEGIGPRFMLLGWFASEAWLAEHADAATRFAKVMREASAWANAHRAESAAMLAARPHTRITPELAPKFVRATYGLDLDPAMLAPVLDFARKHGVLTAPVAPDDLIWQPAEDPRRA